MKKKKVLKGMTLVECVIALAVLAISSSVLTTTCIGITKMKVSTSALNKRVNYQSAIADNRRVQDAYYDDAGNPILDADGNQISSYSNKNDVTLTLTLKGKGVSYNVEGTIYTVSDNDLLNPDGSSKYGDGIVSTKDHNFKFFVEK